MVAPVVRRRFLSFWLASLMLTGALAALVPTASAALTAEDPTIKVYAGTVSPGTESTNDNMKPLKIGSTFWVEVTAKFRVDNRLTECAQSTSPTATVVADLSPFGLSSTTSFPITVGDAQDDGTSLSRNWTATGSKDFVVAENPNHASNTPAFVRLRVNWFCQGTTPSSSSNWVDSAKFLLDAQRPSVTHVHELQGSGGIGSKVIFTFSNYHEDIVTWTLSLTQLTSAPSYSATIGGVSSSVPAAAVQTGQKPSSVEITVDDTGFNAPVGYFNFTDARDQTGSVLLTLAVDAARPAAPAVTIETITVGPPPAVTLRFPPPGDVSEYHIRINTTGGTEQSLRATTLDVQNGLWTIPSSYPLERNTTYYANITANDTKGNVGHTHFLLIPTLQEPRATVVVFVNGTGGIGSPFTVQPTSASLQDAHRIVLEVAALNATGLTWGPGRDFLTANKSAIVEQTPTATSCPQVTGTVFSLSGRSAPVQVVVRNASDADCPFDAKAPAAPSGVRADALPNMNASVSFDEPAAGEGVVSVTLRILDAANAVVKTVTHPLMNGTLAEGRRSFVFQDGNFTAGESYSFDVRATDGRDNVGPLASTASVVIRDSPVSVTLSPPQSPTSIVTGVAGTAVASNPIGAGAIAFSVLNQTTGAYWGGGSSTDWRATPVWHPAGAPDPTSGRWTGAIPGANVLPDGNYRLQARIRDGAGNEALSEQRNLVLDTQAPTKGIGGVALQGGPSLRQGADSATYDLDLQDERSGVAKVEFRLLRASTLAAATYLGNSTPIVHVRALQPDAGGDYDGQASFPLTNVPLGDYRVKVIVSDAAGNSRDLGHLPGEILVRPRVHLTESERYPFADANGLDVEVRAAFDALQPLPNRVCVQRACEVTEVVIAGRERGTTGEGVTLGAVPFPRSATPAHFDGVLYYDYSPSARLPIGELPRENMEIRLRAVVTVGSTTYDTFSDWTRVRTGLRPGGFSMSSPADEVQVYMGGQPFTIPFKIELEQANLAAAPTVTYSVLVVSDDAGKSGQHVKFSGTSLTYGSASETETQVGLTNTKNAFYWYNFTNGVTVPRGEYVITARVDLPGGEQRTLTRAFAVESRTVQIVPAASQPEMVDGQHVGRFFNYTVLVDHGYANLSQTGLHVVIEAANAKGGTRWLRPGTSTSEGSTATLASFQPTLDGQGTNVTYSVALPGNATDGGRYVLYVNVSTDSYAENVKTFTNASIGRPLVVDLLPPIATVFASVSNATGESAGSTLKLTGTAFDSASGIREVEVRIVDLTAQRTFVWNHGGNGSFLPGDLDSWTSSKRQPTSWRYPATEGGVAVQKPYHVQNVVFGPCTSGATSQTSCWVVSDERPRHLGATGTGTTGFFLPIGLDRNHTYEVSVRARDGLGKPSDVATAKVQFDKTPPRQLGIQFGGAASDGVVDWHGGGSITARVQDNHCVKAVRLVGLRPDGQNATPIGFPLPGGPCPGRDAPFDWTLDLASAPLATQHVGRYEYRVEVEDSFGHVVRGNPFHLVVEDTQRAVVREIWGEPPVVRAGTTSRVVAKIEEWGALDRVVVVWHRIDQHGRLVPIKEGLARLDTTRENGNGTYWYVAETAADLNVTITDLGYYQWHVRPYDTRSDVTCPMPAGCDTQDTTIHVTNDAAPTISLRAPAADAAFVNSTPEFRFEVLSYVGTAAGIDLFAGDANGTLAPVPESAYDVTLKGTGAAVTGAEIRYRPTLAASVENYSVRVVATPNQGFANETTFGPFRVDAVAPDVRLNVTGLVRLGDVDWAGSAARVAIEASDAVSGIASRTYRVNGAATPSAYATPVAPTGTGAWRFAATAVDGAGNAGTNETTLQVDTEGPVVSVARPGDDLLLTVTDEGAGVDDANVTVFYAYGDATEFVPLKATRGSGNTFSATLGGDAEATGLQFYVTARDRLGNVGGLGSATDPEVVEKKDDGGDGGEVPPPVNRAPVLRIVSPAPNATMPPGDVRVQWEATDPDGDAVTVTIALRKGANATATPLRSDAAANGTDTVAVTSLGPHAFVVIASDGADTTLQEVAFTVRLEKVVTPVAPLPDAPRLGDPVPILVKVADSGRAIRSVGFVVERDGTRVETGSLTGTGDSFAGSFMPTQPGDYEVFVVVSYAEGPSDKPESLGTFSVIGQASAPSGGATSVAFLALVALAVATIALSAGGAFWRWRK